MPNMVITKDLEYSSKINVQNNNIVITYIPLIRVLIGQTKEFLSIAINCVLDSGCEQNLFPSSWGEILGLSIKSGTKVEYRGIGHGKVIAYAHHLKLSIPYSKINFNTQVNFSYDQKIPLLGRCGFFDQFKKIIFNEEYKKITLEY